MSSVRFQNDNFALELLLADIHRKKLALPDFQRDFVWDVKNAHLLLSSLASGFPTGSLLFLENGRETAFAPHHFEGAPPLGETIPQTLVLDGQQRLTSLYGALYGRHPTHKFFVSLGQLLDGKDMEQALMPLSFAQVAAQKLDDPVQTYDKLLFPLELLFRDGGFSGWVNRRFQQLVVSGGDAKEEFPRHMALSQLEGALKPIREYAFPVVVLPHDTDPEAVCRIFSSVNSTGIRLSAFDLVGARWWAHGIRLRADWNEARTTWPDIGRFFGADGLAVLQALALRAGSACTAGRLLALPPEVHATHWEGTIRGMAEVLSLLQGECGVLKWSLVPYYPALIAMSAAWRQVEAATGPAVGAMRDKLKRWFWCASFGGRYEQSANSRLREDIQELEGWLKGGPLPKVVAHFDIDIDALESITSRNSGIYRAVLAATLARGALDFHERSPLTPKRLDADGVDDHHVFPKKSAAGRGDKRLDCVLNRALIDPVTNRRIQNKDPSVYLAEIASEDGSKGESRLDELLESHLLPTSSESGLREDDFPRFLTERKAILRREIERLCGWTAAQRRMADALVDRVCAALEVRGVLVNRDDPADAWDYHGAIFGEPGRVWFGRWDTMRTSTQESRFLWLQRSNQGDLWPGLLKEVGEEPQDRGHGPALYVGHLDEARLCELISQICEGEGR
jgi:hypothetical protein